MLKLCTGVPEEGAGGEALGTTERSRVPGAVGGGVSGVVGAAEAPEQCGNMEEKRKAKNTFTQT